VTAPYRETVSAEQALEVLGEGLWHTTSEPGFTGILSVGSILVEPNIPDEERWHTLRGPDYYPYVRKLGGVSLFDFEGFEPASYSEQYRLSSWRTFIPMRRERRVAVWIEIDRGMVSGNLIGRNALLERWKTEAAQRHNIMPNLEAAHLGDIPIDAFVRAFVVRQESPKLEAVAIIQK